MDLEDVYNKVDKDSAYLEEKLDSNDHPFWVPGVVWKEKEKEEDNGNNPA